jgi:hypothetical protein
VKSIGNEHQAMLLGNGDKTPGHKMQGRMNFGFGGAAAQ